MWSVGDRRLGGREIFMIIKIQSPNSIFIAEGSGGPPIPVRLAWEPFGRSKSLYVI
jgi:hypothetical protein